MVEMHWGIATPKFSHAPAWRPWGSIGKIGLPAPVEDDGEEDSRLALRIWSALYTERRAAYDKWVQGQFEIACRAIDDALTALRGRDPLAIVEDGHMDGYLALFGRDEYAGRVCRVAPHVDDARGAQVLIEFETTFGGGPNWFGPPGHRYYEMFLDVEGGAGWDVPPNDEGYDRLVAAIMARRDAAYARFVSAHDRVRRTIGAMWDRVKDDHPQSRVRHGRAVRAGDRLYEQVEALRPVTAHPFRDWGLLAPVDIWPGMSARARRRLPVVQERADGWYARLRAAAALAA